MISDDTLLLYYGDELDGAESAQVEEALQRDAELAHRYQQLLSDLEQLRNQPVSPAPAGAHAAWHETISRQTARSRPAGLASWWQPAFAAAAGIVAVVLFLRMDPDPVQMVTAERVLSANPVVEPGTVPFAATPSFSRGLVSYMQTTRSKLVELDSEDTAAREAIIAEILAHNRAFERAATEHGVDDIARVLRAFEQSLVNLGKNDEQRERIDQLAFEYGAMLTRIAPRASNQPYKL